ncbi:YbhB/YbcL family Raf kinase inhibitor-like protein [Mycolicibacter icosiumassiliensis]|uniref:YbhB/YbcL family Raf kinase inhibitor-like protein n=1 Tax=Mycolicibacter icosiumassiliensis TaxID=1792835 RepID=UPI00098FDB18|nr:YbhB/YbcL family Raf kinase inhibitor-like protein [Mycolicibacter icosiumassiliensis]
MDLPLPDNYRIGNTVIAVLGRLLQPFSGHDSKTAWHHPATSNVPDIITVTSAAFGDGHQIPLRHAGNGLGDNISPPLSWSGVPANAAELVLIVEDPDAPLPRPIVHALATAITPSARSLTESELNPDTGSARICIGRGSFKRHGYAGPRPIPGHGPHRYIFQLFALNQPSGLDTTATIKTTLAAIHGHVIARGRLTGTYER